MSRFETPQSALVRAKLLASRETQRQRGWAAKVQQMRQRTRPRAAPQEQMIETPFGPRAPSAIRESIAKTRRGPLRAATEPGFGKLGLLGKVPVAGPTLQRTGEFATSPVGLASAAVMPGLTAAGLAGQAIGGTIGGGLEAAGVGDLQTPFGGISPRTIGEFGGGFATPGLLSAPGRAASRRIGTQLGENARAAGGLRQLAAQEAGGTDINSMQWRRVLKDIAQGNDSTPDNFAARQAAENRLKATGKAPEELMGEGPPSGIPEPEDPVKKLTGLIRQAKPVRAATQVLKTEELRRRAGEVATATSGAPGREGLGAALGQMKGQLPKAQFEPVEAGLAKPEIDDLFNRVWSGPRQPFEKINTASALEGILTGQLPTRGEIKMLEDTFGTDFAKALLSKRTLGQKAWENFVDTLNLPRAVLSSWDASAPLRQALVLTIGRPRQSVPALGRMFKAMGSERVARAVEQGIAESPNNALYRSSGLYIAPRLGAASEIGAREESFMNSLAHHIPGIRASERAYITYLNKLRTDVFDSVVKGWEGKSAQDYSDLASYINHATGRGDLGALQGSAPILNAVFFSPRLLTSRIQLPIDVLIRQPAVRKEAARDLASTLALGATILKLAELGGAEVSLNPQKADFGKIKIGTQRIDFWGGFQQIARYSATIAAGAAAGDKEKVQETLLRFLRSKLAPTTGLGVDLWKGKTMIGEPVDFDLDEGIKRLTPLFLQDLAESIKYEGLMGGIRATPGLLGVGIQAYRPTEPKPEPTPKAKKKTPRVNPDLPNLNMPSRPGRSTSPLQPIGSR